MKQYEDLEMSIIFFNSEDIITASCPADECASDVGGVDTPPLGG